MDKLRTTIAMAALLGACVQDERPQMTPADASGAQSSPPAPVMPAVPLPAAQAGAAAPMSPQQAIDQSSPPPLQDGYQRFETMPLELAPGASNDWAQWVGGPLDQDYDVVTITGWQSRGGHHAIMYATTEAQAPGYTRLWEDSDQLTTRLMGGVGGEGGANVSLPPGVVFRVQKGSYLVIQTHYLNASDQPIIGRTVLDLKLGPVDPSHRVASIMASTDAAVSLPPGQSMSMDVYCEVQKDLHFLQISNHMHEHGSSTFTEYLDAAGVAHELKSDPLWSYDWALNPNFKAFPLESPLVVAKGSKLHTRCSWDNETDGVVAFPTEMCVFFGFILNPSDIYCQAGQWSEAATNESQEPQGNEPQQPPPQAASCANGPDRAIMDGAAFEQQSTDCGTGCAFDPDAGGCAARCLVGVGLSPACAACNGEQIACGAEHCLVECAADSASPPCRECVARNCDAAYQLCKGA